MHNVDEETNRGVAQRQKIESLTGTFRSCEKKGTCIMVKQVKISSFTEVKTS